MDDAGLNGIGCAGTEACCQQQWQHYNTDPVAPHDTLPAKLGISAYFFGQIAASAR
jgi:hypothetical protein